jgi:hypothetical protein
MHDASKLLRLDEQRVTHRYIAGAVGLMGSAALTHPTSSLESEKRFFGSFLQKRTAKLKMEW